MENEANEQLIQEAAETAADKEVNQDEVAKENSVPSYIINPLAQIVPDDSLPKNDDSAETKHTRKRRATVAAAAAPPKTPKTPRASKKA